MSNFRHVMKCRGGSGGDLPSFLPSGPLPHAEAGASPDLETLGVPSLLCTRVSFELCAYTLKTHNADCGKWRGRCLLENSRRTTSKGGHDAGSVAGRCVGGAAGGQRWMSPGPRGGDADAPIPDLPALTWECEIGPFPAFSRLM